jgi:hypothetical protein
VQIVRKSVLKTGDPYLKHAVEKSQFRRTPDGWAVDRQPSKYGWYGYDDTGKPAAVVPAHGLNAEDVVTIRPGSSPRPLTTAILDDIPGLYNLDPNDPKQKPVQDIRVEFETYAIAKSGPDKGLIYGGIAWGFDVGNLNILESLPRKYLARPSQAFRSAVFLWDLQAFGPENERTVPDQAPLGRDIRFPPRQKGESLGLFNQ